MEEVATIHHTNGVIKFRRMIPLDNRDTLLRKAEALDPIRRRCRFLRARSTGTLSVC